MALRVEPILKSDTWDDFVFRYSPGALFQTWTWGEVLRGLHHKIVRYGYYDGDKLVGVAQIVKVKARRGAFLHVRHGPVLADNHLTHWKQIIKHIKEVAKEEGVWFIRMSPLLPVQGEASKLFADLHASPSPMHAMDAEICWVLDLAPTEEQILSGMRKNTRYDVKKALKEGVEIVMSKDEKDLVYFDELYRETSSRHHFVQHVGIQEEFREFLKNDEALLILGKHEGKVLGAAIILFSGDQAIYHHGASITSRVPVSYLIQWHAIREAKKRRKKLYNFWGIAPNDSESHPWRGITVFKKGFGGRQVEYTHAQDLPVSPLYVIPRLIEGIRKKLKGL